MCGIFGTNNPEMLPILIEKNSLRGSYSYGILDVTVDKTLRLFQGEGVVPRNYKLKGTVLAHQRAPTSTSQKYNPTQSHPFSGICKSFFLAHNGIITNADTKYEIDTLHAVSLLSEYYKKEDFKESIIRMVSEISGTYCFWIYDTINDQTFLIRSDNTLYYNQDYFSSSPITKDDILLKNNHIYEVDFNLKSIKITPYKYEKTQYYFIP